MRAWLIVGVLGVLGGCGGGGGGVDAGAADGGVDAGAFVCNQATCDEVTQYCYVVQAGVVPGVGCNPYPQSCGDAPSCECVLADIDTTACGGGLFCSADGDRITVACMLP